MKRAAQGRTETVNAGTDAPQGEGPGAAGTPTGRIRSAVDRRLKRMREGIPWVRHANPRLLESYGAIVDLDLGWRMVDSTLEQHRSGQIELDDERLEALSALWETLTAEVVSTPRRDLPEDGEDMACELRAAVEDRLRRMADEMRRDERAAIRMMNDYEALVDLDLGWRMIEETLTRAERDELDLDDEIEQELISRWRELTTELVAILGRHHDEVSETPSQAALDNLFEFSLAA